MDTYKQGQVKGQDMKNMLEAMIDTNSLQSILYALSEIAYEKGQHLRENWQDSNAAKEWERDAKLIEKAGGKVTF